MTEYTVDRQTDKCQCRGLLFVEVYIQCIVFRLPLIAVVVVLSGARVFEATCADAGVIQREELDTFSNRYLTAATTSTAVSIVFHWLLHPCITVFCIHKSNLLHQRDIDLLFGTQKKDKIVCSGRVPFSNGYASLMFL